MQNLPFYVYLIFVLTILLTLWLIFEATQHSKFFLILLISWITIQSLAAIAGFYNNQHTMTARFPFLILPPLIFMICCFTTRKGKLFIDHLNLPVLTIIHIIRIPVEFILFWLFVTKSIPQAMTFEGRNFDMFSGITAPFVYYFGFVKKILNKKIILAWNFICLGLLVNVVANAILSLPARFQIFGFEEPNVALGYFPFVLLPAFVVPIVMFSMLASVRQLIRKDYV